MKIAVSFALYLVSAAFLTQPGFPAEATSSARREAAADDQKRLAGKISRNEIAGLLEELNKAIERHPTLAWPHAFRAIIRNNSGDIYGAMTDASRAITLDPTFPLGFTARAQVRFRIGDFAGSVDDYTRVIALEPTSAEAYWNRAGPKVYLRDFDGAIADAEQALKLNPTAYLAYRNRAIARLAKGDRLGAETDFNKAIENGPEDPENFTNRANFLLIEKKDVDGAIADCTKAISMKPEFAVAFHLRGNARKSKGDLVGAIEDLNRAKQIEASYQPKR